MPSLKDIKRRIKTVKSTQKITQAMYMIATTKLKKAEVRVHTARPFASELKNTFKRLLDEKVMVSSSSAKFPKAIYNYASLMEQRPVKNVALIVVGSNKGLSGAYVTNVVRATLEKIHHYEEQGIGTKLFIIGQRAYNGLKRTPKIEIVKLYNNLNEVVTTSEAAVIAEDIAEAYVDHIVDKIEIITTDYVTRLTNAPKCWPLLPVELAKDDSKAPRAEMLFIPNVEEILQKVVHLYIATSIYQSLLEAYASELASRMTAMKSATDNAEDVISSLTLTYNKARQTAITQEILEVVSGSEALE